jgi:biotin carboxyl carrier protein
VIAARTAATEAGIAYQLAQQQVSAAGGGGGQLNRIAITAPISGQVIARSVVLGQTVPADAELYRIANLSSVSLSLNLQPADAGRIRPGAVVSVQKHAGDAVKRGEAVVTIESMKLQTVLPAPRDGVIAKILKGEGETFEKDEVIVTLEPEDEKA